MYNGNLQRRPRQRNGSGQSNIPLVPSDTMVGLHLEQQVMHGGRRNYNAKIDDIPIPPAVGPAVYGTRPNVPPLRDFLANDPNRPNWAPDPLPPSPFTINNPSGVWVTITRGVMHAIGNPPDRKGNQKRMTYGTGPGEAPLSWKKAMQDAYTNGVYMYNGRIRCRQMGYPDPPPDARYLTPSEMVDNRNRAIAQAQSDGGPVVARGRRGPAWRRPTGR
ncbi:MAG: hypothetical protein M1828_000753 [Chrysothrix sp. TS-e1954]|nr:MAG: hypothetical protein M1828_000753 [Chrysothrix sp. TS-e1954]